MSRHPGKPTDDEQDAAAEAFYGADDEEEVRFRTAVRTILRGFEEGVFVRSTTHDHDPAWAIRLFPFIQALAVAHEAFGLPVAVAAVDPQVDSTGTPTPRV